MTTALYFFIMLAAFSFIELAALFGYRAWEMRRGDLFARGQSAFVPTFQNFIRNALALERVTLAATFYAARAARRLLVRAYHALYRNPFVARYSEYLSDVMKGKRVLDANGTASVFLQTIASHKEHLRDEERRNNNPL